MAVPDGAAELDWIVCLEEQREVVAGTVSCPLAATEVGVAECMECRHLGYVRNERWMSLWCATPDVASPRLPVTELPVLAARPSGQAVAPPDRSG